MPITTRDASIDVEVARVSGELVRACARLHRRGLLAGYEGNLSARLSNGDVLVTSTGADKADMTLSQICWLDADGVPVPDIVRDSATRPSSEWEMHRACYAARPDVRAIVHAHPPVATGFAAAGQTLPADVLPELPVVVGPIALVPYARPGTTALARAMHPFLPSHQVFLLTNHGVTTLGSSLSDAVLRMESVEQAARVLMVARVLGGEQRLGGDEVAALMAMHAATREAGDDTSNSSRTGTTDPVVTTDQQPIPPYSAISAQETPT